MRLLQGHFSSLFTLKYLCSSIGLLEIIEAVTGPFIVSAPYTEGVMGRGKGRVSKWFSLGEGGKARVSK
jgi:hypothetical protein